MFGTFRKHSTWLWGILIAVMAVSLVFWGNPGSQSGSDGKGNLGSIAGEPVTIEDLQKAAAEAKLQYFMSRGEWPGPGAEREGFDLNIEAYKRLFIIQKQEELGIHIGSDQVAKVAARDLKALAKGAPGVTMSVFEQNLLKPGGLTIADYERFLRHQLGMQQLISAVTVGSKLVTTQEARAIFERENQDISAQVVFFGASNYLAGVEASPEVLSQFYSNQVARYRIPERIQVSYVEFKATNFWEEAAAEITKMTNLPALLEAEYTRRGTNFYPEMTPEQAKESIRDEYYEQLALRAANHRANEFADPLLSADTIRAEDLAERAKEQGVPMQVTAPFDRSSTPAGMDVSENFVQAAFALREDEPIVGPVVASDAVYVIARHKQIPSEIPSYEEVKEQVASDYKQFEALKAARAAATAFVEKATNSLAEGKVFGSVAADAKVSPTLLPPFSRSTRSLPEVEDHMSLQQFKQIAFGTEIGKVSPAVPTMEGSVVVYVQARMELDEQKVNAELGEFVTMLRQARQEEAFQEWFGREAQRALANTPVMRPAPSELSQPNGN